MGSNVLLRSISHSQSSGNYAKKTSRYLSLFNSNYCLRTNYFDIAVVGPTCKTFDGG